MSTTGVWTLDDAFRYIRDGAWPTAAAIPSQPAGPPPQPNTIPGLTGWWDASDQSTLFDAEEGGSAVAADGQVMRWEDKSGNGVHLFPQNSNSSLAPIRKTGILASRDIVRFDGIDDRMQSYPGTWASIVSSDQFTMFAVARAASISGDNAPPATDLNASIFTDGITTSLNFRSSGLVGASVYVTGNSYANAFAGYTANAWKAFSSRFSVPDGQVAVRVNGGTAATGAASSNQFSIFGRLRVGDGGARFNGDIAEILTYNVALSASQRESVESYLMGKWGIS